MDTKYFISVDIGTQGTKAAIVSEYGDIVSSSFQPSNLIRPRKGVVEQDPEEMFSSVIDGIKEALQLAQIDPMHIAAIGLDGQMAGIMGIDEAWNAVTPYDSWLDTRSEKYMPMIKDWGEERFIEITGCPVTYAHGPKKLWWKHERPDVYKRIYKFILPTTYVVGRLAGFKGDEAYIDHTHLHFTGFADVSRQAWSNELLDAFGIDRSKMPFIRKPWDIVGHLQQSYAEYCGLPSGIPITAGCGDTASTILGAGITEKGKILDIAGTASVLSCCVDEYQPDTTNKTLVYARSVIPELWTPLAYMNGGGQCLEWFKELVSQEEGSFSFDELNEGAEKVELGSQGLYFIPHFAGRVCPNNPSLRGGWLGLSWSHDKFSMYRSVLEAIAYEYRFYLDIIQKSNPHIEFTNVNGVGGGSKSTLFNSIKSNVLNVPYTTLQATDSAILANAAVAGYGTGVFADIGETINQWVETKDSMHPDMKQHEMYRPYADQYQSLMHQLTPIYESIRNDE